MDYSVQKIWWASALLFMLSCVLLILQNDEAFVACSFVGAGLGVVLTALIVTNKDAVRFAWIIAAALLIGNAGGVVTTWLNSSSFEEFAYAAKYRPQSLLAITLAVVYLCCAIAIVVGRFERPCFDLAQLPDNAGRFAVILVGVEVLVVLAAYINGDYGYGGVQVNESTGRISGFSAIADLGAAPAVGVCGYVLGRSKGMFERVAFSMLGLIVLLSIVPSGRRPIVLALLVAAIGFSLSGGLKRLSMIQIAVGALIFGTFAYLTTSYFYALRLSFWELGPGSSLFDQMSLAFDFLVSPALQERFSALLSENIRERTFAIGYLADLIEATWRTAPLYGDAFMFYIRIAIPAALDPSKSTILDYQQIENMAHPKLGLPVLDQANSVLTDGVTDFGLPGALIYLLGIVAMSEVTLRLMQRVPAPVTCLFAGLVLVHLGLEPEFTLSDYFVTIRNLTLMFVLLGGAEYFIRSELGAMWIGSRRPAGRGGYGEPHGAEHDLP
jgi:hypothetical protein